MDISSPLRELARHEGEEVVLRFSDGHVVQARLLHVDATDRDEIIYVVTTVLAAGTPDLANVPPGITACAPANALVAFDVVR